MDYEDLSEENQSLRDIRDSLQKAKDTQAKAFKKEKEKLEVNLKQKDKDCEELESSLSTICQELSSKDAAMQRLKDDLEMVQMENQALKSNLAEL